MSSEGYPFPVLEDAESEIGDILKDYFRAIYVEAVKLANKDGHPYIDQTYIRRAAKRIRIMSNSHKMVWGLRMLFLIVLPIVIAIQIGGLRASEVLASPVGVQISLWLLPIYLIFLIIVVSWVLKDFIF